MPVATYCLTAVDCPDPPALADFYAALLGGEVKKLRDDWYDVYAPGGHRIAFQRAEGHQPPQWPRADDSQQLHIDLNVTDMAAAEAAVLSLGAMPLDLEDRNGQRGFRVYADPAGHPFCLCRA
ncbi:VOC family protein [Streptomyces longispororuber]|uniref:VOC family protein n=1 Tax=Streptomyces longispororuber TaxID=68230 RepID=UPI00210B42A2|nr:VOC family protein [Streptomyces longispororuber]MCQ4205557.1 VOC family protein [Streptomyces longispororuber]